MNLTNKKLIAQLKKIIQEDFGKKCPEYAVGCWVCMAYRAFEDLSDILDVGKPVVHKK
jgi:hypothetical protein